MRILHIFKHKLILVGGILIIGSASAATYQHANTNAIAYYTNSKGQKVEMPDHNSKGATALCKDGIYSHSQSRRGSCSGHKGVSKWLGKLATTGSATSSSDNSDSSTSDTLEGASTTYVPVTNTYKPPTTPSISGPSGYTPTTYTPPPVTCNQSLEAQDEATYNSEVAAENSNYQSQLAVSQQQASNQLGGMSTGLGGNNTAQITAQHQQRLSNLQSTLNSELAIINC